MLALYSTLIKAVNIDLHENSNPCGKSDISISKLDISRAEKGNKYSYSSSNIKYWSWSLVEGTTGAAS